MVKNGSAAQIRDISFRRSSIASPGAEVTDLRTLRVRGGPREFDRPQRPSFDLLLVMTAGSALHTVDFATFPLVPGDVLWVRAGQVQQWGDLHAIEADVVLFVPTLIDPPTTELLRGAQARSRNHFPSWVAAEAEHAASLSALMAVLDSTATDRSIPVPVRDAVLGRLLSAMLLLIAGPDANTPVAGGSAAERIVLALNRLVEENFARRRSVEWYSGELGYAGRTVNQAVRAQTGITAKQFIDARVMLEARRMLVHERVTPVAEIAQRLGFDDPANFSKYFTQRDGTTPGRFRELSAGGGSGYRLTRAGSRSNTGDHPAVDAHT